MRQERSGNTIKQRLEYYSTPEPNTGCWLWSGSTRGFKSHQYGTLNINGKNLSAHRLSFEVFKGSIPDGLHIMHKCDNTYCINPDHLVAGTRKDNMDDCVRKGRNPTMFIRKICQRGHMMTGHNVRIKIRKDRGGKAERSCRECGNLMRRQKRGNA